MATETCKAQDGSRISEGAVVKAKLRHGDTEVEVRGTVHTFRPNTDQIAELEAKLATLRADNGVRWELVPDGSDREAVGFLPENVLTAQEIN